MIASISGQIKALNSSSAVVEVGGVGILVNLPTRLATSLIVGTSVSFATSLLVREDALTLYGFEDSDSRNFFEMLQTVTGIGPRVAQSALNVLDYKVMIAAIQNEDAKSLEAIPGLGKKGAARLILELKEKVADQEAVNNAGVPSWRRQLEQALLGLGFNPRDSQEILHQVAAEFNGRTDASEIPAMLKFALQLKARK